MPIYHLERRYVSRKKGYSACAGSAYISGQIINCLYYDIQFDYTKHLWQVVSSKLLLPPEAPVEFRDNPKLLWSMAEMWEKRKDSRVAEELIVSFPIELSLIECENIIDKYIKKHFVSRNIGAQIAIHDKRDGNPHAHIILTTRFINRDGFGEKDRGWTKNFLMSLRKGWADIQNREFEKKGLECRVSHLSNVERGIDKIPSKRISKKEVKLKKQGIKSQRVLDNEKIEKLNQENELKKQQKREVHRKKSRGIER